MREPVHIVGGPRAGAGASAVGDAGTPAVASVAPALERVARAAAVGLWEWCLERDEVWWSEGLAQLLGRRQAASATGPSPWAAAIHPADRAGALRDLRGMAEDGELRTSAYRVVRPDGEVRWVLCRGAATRRRDGRPVRLGGVVVDVTDDPDLAQRLAATAASMADATVAVDRRWRVTHANPAAAALLGPGVVGAALWPSLAGAVDPGFASRCREVVTVPCPVATELPAGAGARWYEVEAHGLEDGVLVTLRDVTARHQAARERDRLLAAEQVARRAAARVRAELEHAATHDALTGLANRAALMSWLTDGLARAGAGGGDVAVCFLDLDRLKGINDSLGHLEGDRVLVEVARRLTEMVRGDDVVARLGGDEFVLATRGLSRQSVEDVARRVLEGVTAPMEVAGRRLRVTTSVGIAMGTRATTPEALLADADAALYLAKAAGGDRFAVFDEAVRATTVARRALEAELHDAVAAGELCVWYQPTFDLATAACTGAEALVRWRHPRRGLLAPADFLPVAETSDLAALVGEHVLGLVCGDVASGRCGAAAGTVWVNVSARQLSQPAFTDVVASALARTGVTAGAVGVEVTEAALARDPTATATTLTALAALGVPIAVDDFGTGASSLARLAASPVRQLRIDRSFVGGADAGQPAPLLPALVGLAHAIGAAAGAEGVETPAQLAALRALGVDEASGHLFAPAVPASGLAAAVAAGRRALRSPGPGAPDG